MVFGLSALNRVYHVLGESVPNMVRLHNCRRKQLGRKIDSDVLLRVGILGIFLS